MKKIYKLLLLFCVVLMSIIACEERESGVKPTACFTASSDEVYVGESVKFTDCSENAISYLWEFGDNTNSVIESPVHKFESEGEFLVVLRVSNKDLHDDTQKTIKVREMPEGEISVKTYNVSNVTTNSATVSGSVLYEGELLAKGVCWNTSPNPIVGANYTNEGTEAGDFTSDISGLEANKTYYVRAYATTNNGPEYGEELDFTTKSVVAEPTVVTVEVSSVTSSKAIVKGNITDNGGGSITKSGVCWGINQNPDLNDNVTTDGANFGEYDSEISGLAPNQTYHVRAYATNSSGTAFGNDLIFTTEDYVPGKLIEVEPSIFKADEEITIYFNAQEGDGGLAGYEGDVYIYTGLITENSNGPSGWQYVLVLDWFENQDKAKMERVDNDLYKWVISPSINEVYGCPTSERVYQIACVFRSEDATLSGRMPDESDIFIDVERNTVYAQKTNEAPVIDGEIDAVWNTVQPRIIETAWPQQWVSLMKSATFKALWDDDNIYVLVEVPDDDFYPSSEAGTESWLADKPELYFDVNSTRVDGGGPDIGAGHYQFAPAYGENHFAACKWSYGIDIKEEFYKVEYAIAIDSLIDAEGKVLNPQLRSPIGFDITIIDLDEPGYGANNAVGRINWVNNVENGESWNTLDYSGNMIFME